VKNAIKPRFHFLLQIFIEEDSNMQKKNRYSKKGDECND